MTDVHRPPALTLRSRTGAAKPTLWPTLNPCHFTVPCFIFKTKTFSFSSKQALSNNVFVVKIGRTTTLRRLLKVINFRRSKFVCTLWPCPVFGICAAGLATHLTTPVCPVARTQTIIDLLPNYGLGTSKRYRKPVTTDNTVISNCERRNFRRSSDLAEAKIYLFAVLVIFDMPSTNHFFWSFCSQVGITTVLEGFSGVFVFGLSALLYRDFDNVSGRLGPLKIGLVILGNLRKC